MEERYYAYVTDVKYFTVKVKTLCMVYWLFSELFKHLAYNIWSARFLLQQERCSICLSTVGQCFPFQMKRMYVLWKSTVTFVHGNLWNLQFFFSVALHFGSVFSLLDEKDGHLMGSNILFVCQILTVKIAVIWDVTSCGVVENYWCC